MKILGIVASIQKGLSTFFDTFTSGFTTGWTSIRSGWTAGSGVATASTNDYPISTVTMSAENVTSSIVNDTNNSGAGVAFWVTDANNWWGLASKQTDTYYSYTYSCNCSTTSYSCNCSGGPYSCNCTGGPYECNCVTNGPYGVQCSTNGPFYSGYGFYYTYSCSFYYYTTTCQTCNNYSCQTCNNYSCQTCYSYSCQSCNATGTTNNYYLKLYNSIAGTVSELTSITLSAIAKGVRVVTNGVGITGKAYSDTGFTSQTGSDLTYTATGATRTKLHGILIAPSTQSQSTTIDSFQSDTN